MNKYDFLDKLISEGKEDEILKYIAETKSKLAKEKAEKEKIEKQKAEREERLSRFRKNVINSFRAYIEVLADERVDIEEMKVFENSLIDLENRVDRLKRFSDSLKTKTSTAKTTASEPIVTKKTTTSTWDLDEVVRELIKML